jgi:eukaryotic-like serine/threonine-protein kinase
VDINGVPLEMVYIPAGNFSMGCTSPLGHQLEHQLVQPIHLVTLESFFIGKYHITQKQYLALMGINPAYFKGNDRQPVEQVSWQDAMEFCRRLSELTNKNFTLPSESQWEYACRAGTDTKFYLGQKINSKLVNFDDFTTGNSFRGGFLRRTAPVGTYPPNSWGLYDMHGNVRDWCLDTYHHSYIGAPSDGSAWIEVDLNDYDDSWDYHSFRGGSWNDTEEMCMSYQRGFSTMRTRQNGFRVCMVLNSDDRYDILSPIKINENHEEYEDYEEE